MDKNKKKIINTLEEPYNKKISLETKQNIMAIKKLENERSLKGFMRGLLSGLLIFIFIFQLEVFSFLSIRLNTLLVDYVMGSTIIINVLGYSLLFYHYRFKKQGELDDLIKIVENNEEKIITEIKKEIRRF